MPENKERKGIGCLPFMIALTGVWALCFGKNNELPIQQRYALPSEIRVVETTLPHREENRILTLTDNNGRVIKKETFLEKIVDTKDIDFSQDFRIRTERYNLIKEDDWLPSRIIGHIASLPRKLYFWDWDIGYGLDADRSMAVLAMLENNPKIKDITVRVNHNKAFYDGFVRMFSDEKVTERNPFLVRATLGVLTALKDEALAELFRIDYYNPLTQTAVVYSNIECVPSHEIGHHVDFHRFDTDWIYALSRIVPPVMLYQEWVASRNAISIMSQDDRWQFNRYLIPAFAAYVLATIAGTGKLLKGRDSKD